MSTPTQDAVLMRFAKENGMKLGQARYLVRIANKAGDLQERETGTAGMAARVRLAQERVEEYAARFGLGTSWPGCYPLLHRGKEVVHVPD